MMLLSTSVGTSLLYIFNKLLQPVGSQKHQLGIENLVIQKAKQYTFNCIVKLEAIHKITCIFCLTYSDDVTCNGYNLDKE